MIICKKKLDVKLNFLCYTNIRIPNRATANIQFLVAMEQGCI